MVARELRRTAAYLVRRFRDGEITNDDFESEWPEAEGDRALHAIETMLWAFYSDLYGHRLEGRHALTDEGRALFDRCALFLETDLEYEWPEDDFRGIGSLGPWLRILTLGLSALIDRRTERKHRALHAKLERAGDLDVWPFIRRSDFTEAASRSVSAVRFS